MTEKKFERWYDKEEDLSLVMKALEFADDDIKLSIAADLIQMVMANRDTESTDEFIEDINEEYVPVRRRWYDEFETVHNYIGQDNIIRKGAISCKKDEKVLIPLNMADGSLIAVGLGNEDWNNSAPHGAGRMYSRSQAKDLLTMKEYKERMKNIYSSCISFETLDESPMAYKDASIIKGSISPTAKLIDHLIPVYNFKASE